MLDFILSNSFSHLISLNNDAIFYYQLFLFLKRNISNLKFSISFLRV